ncbi:MAG: alanine--tRNA ligase-related protein [Polyangiales bacterium]
MSRPGFFVMEEGMTATTLLYHRDPHLLTFDGVVAAVEVDPAGRQVVVLRETAFYPEAGGQMADHGVLGGARVTDVQVGDDGVVRHIVEGGFAAAVGDAVAGVVDGARRRQHMAMHTAQHILSQALLTHRARAETVSARLGETICTVDVDVALPSPTATCSTSKTPCTPWSTTTSTSPRSSPTTTPSPRCRCAARPRCARTSASWWWVTSASPSTSRPAAAPT